MRDLGVDPAKANIRTTRYQDAVPYFVENNFSDLGVTASAAVVKEWQSKGGAVLFESKPVPIKHMIASTKMSEADVEKVREVMLGLENSEAGKKILAKLGYLGYTTGDEQKLAVITQWLGY
jgi:ABC-type phosphate/phosphonate transport system substrate-binding protein